MDEGWVTGRVIAEHNRRWGTEPKVAAEGIVGVRDQRGSFIRAGRAKATGGSRGENEWEELWWRQSCLAYESTGLAYV